MKDWILNKIKKDFTDLYIGHIDENEKETRMLIKLREKFSTINPKFFDFEGSHPSIIIITNLKDFELEKDKIIEYDQEYLGLSDFPDKQEIWLLPWDGTEIKCNIKNIGKNIGKIIEYNTFCNYTPMKTPLAGMIDNIKFLFGIHKTGLHWNKKYIFYSNENSSEITDDTDILPEEIEKVRKILAFKYLFNISPIDFSGIMRRNNILYSINDNMVDKEDVFVNFKILNRFFSKRSIHQVIFSMIEYYGKSYEIIEILEKKIKKIVSNPYASIILDRIIPTLKICVNL